MAAAQQQPGPPARSPHGQLAVPALPGSRPPVRLVGEMRVLVEEQDGARTKDAGWVLALHNGFYAGSRTLPAIDSNIRYSSLDEAVEIIIAAWMKADKDTGGV